MKRYHLPVALVVAFALALSLHAITFAHGHIAVGDYELVVGFSNEPAYQGEPNGLDLFVTHHETGEPVTGLEETLQVEIIRGSATQALQLRAAFGEEGAYTTNVLPTEAGDYTWHIWGEIEGTPVDVSMTSGPDTFSPVRAKAEVSFPAAEPTATELQATAAAAAASARTATLLGIAGLVLGLVGTVIGVLGMRNGRQRATAASMPSASRSS